MLLLILKTKKFLEYYTSKFAEKVDLSNLKSNVVELDIDKLKNVPTNLSKVVKVDIDKLVPAHGDLSKISDVAKNYVVKKRCI